MGEDVRDEVTLEAGLGRSEIVLAFTCLDPWERQREKTQGFFWESGPWPPIDRDPSVMPNTVSSLSNLCRI